MNVAAFQEWLSAFTARALDWTVSTGLSILAVLAVALLFARLYRLAVKRMEDLLAARTRKSTRVENLEELNQRIATLSSLLRKAGIAVIWIMTGMIVLKEAGIDIAPLLAGAGIFGLAVGFGAQNLVRDVVSGFFIILENQVSVGDVAVINGTGGLVEEINLRTIVLRDLSGVVHVFPNGTINTLSNMTKEWSAMVYEIGVAYKEDTDRVTDVMREVAEDLRRDPDYGAKILEPIEILGVESFGDSAVVIKARQKTKPITQWAVGREYRRRLKKAFDERGIEIPFPHRTLCWGEASRPFEALVRDGRKEA